MKIISERKGFQADHSSTSYEFLAIDRKLGKGEKAKVSKLSSRANPTSSRVSFSYNGDYSDLPGGWEPLMAKYYDVMYSESYDWWTLAIAFHADKEVTEKIKGYAFNGVDDLGVNVKEEGGRLTVSINCHLDTSSIFTSSRGRYSEYDDEDDDEDDGEDETSCRDPLLKLLASNREYLEKGDCRLLYGIWLEYGDQEDDDSAPPETEMTKLPTAIKKMLSLLEQV